MISRTSLYLGIERGDLPIKKEEEIVIKLQVSSQFILKVVLKVISKKLEEENYIL